MRIWPFGPSRAHRDAEALLAAVQAASRRPALYGAGRVPDTMDGRFGLLKLHAAFVLMRLKGEAGVEPLAQAFTDTLFRHLDAGLREAGVGDTSVPKRMRALAGSFYGRLEAYAASIAAADMGALSVALARDLGAPQAFADALAALAIETAKWQAAAPVIALTDLSNWPELAF